MSATTGRRAALEAHAADPSLQHVVLATNGDAAAEAAVRWLAHRARAHVLDVEIVEVAKPRTVPAGGDGVGRARELLALHAPSVRAEAHTRSGDPHRVLTDLSRHADLLVLGTRRRSGGPPHLTAAFATRVAEAARCPTVVVPLGWQVSPGPVVLGVAGDGSDDAAVDFAAREAIASHRDLVLVHAWHLIAVVAPALQVDLDGQPVPHTAGGRLDAVAERARAQHPLARVVRVLEQGDPVDALVRAGRGAALLVVGTHALTLVDRLLLRSVSRGVLERPECPVAIVPPVEASRGAAT